MTTSDEDIDGIVAAIRAGDAGATDALFQVAYDRLRRLAASYMRNGADILTLQPTAAVHEAYMRLRRPEGNAWEGRAHFLGVASKAIRHVLVDAARRRNAAKRGGGHRGITLVEGLLQQRSDRFDVLDLDEALQELAALDERSAQVVEMRFFGGMSIDEVATALGCSRTTVKMDWATAKTWLARRLGPEESTS
jgi:RNA polymerase sigma-70 factor (ECF subfamily)